MAVHRANQFFLFLSNFSYLKNTIQIAKVKFISLKIHQKYRLHLHHGPKRIEKPVQYLAD